MKADPRPAKRVRDSQLLARLHRRWHDCALSDDSCEPGLSLHHLSKHPRDDLVENLVMLCGHGTAGHHGRVEAHDEATLEELREYLRWERPDAWLYLVERRHTLAVGS